MRIAIASDHAAYREKAALVATLTSEGHQVLDFGTEGPDSVDYPDTAEPAARAVSRGDADRGLLLCGTGIGQCMVANKVPGVRAAVLWNDLSAEMSRRHNDANVACLGARVTSLDEMRRLVSLWLATPFDGGRHERRVAKINALDGVVF